MASLATLNDINTHLEETRLKATDAEVELLQLDALRVVKGMLSNTYSPATLAGWTDPSETDPNDPDYVPEIIRAIAGRFIAAKYYARKTSIEQVEVPDYAQWLYDAAMADLNAIIAGTLVLIDVDEVVDTGSTITDANFNFPDEPKFSMGMNL